MNETVCALPFNRISGPHRAENLELFLLLGPDRCQHPYLTLSEALEHKLAVVFETGKVQELEIENLSPDRDLFVLAGEVVKGGHQDRVMGVDLVVPAKSQRIKIPAFCVEQRRWAPRRAEDAANFSSSSSMLAKDLMLKVKREKSQVALWNSVRQAQADLSTALACDVASSVSPSSYQLMMESQKLRERQADFRDRFSELVNAQPDTIGFAFAISGTPSSADLFASNKSATAFSGKLVDAALVTALAEGSRKEHVREKLILPDDIYQWLAAGIEPIHSKSLLDVPPRLRVEQCEYGNALARTACFASLEVERGVYLHRSWSTMSNQRRLLSSYWA